jgi:indolepyruvate ferredoxin oxidoreductase
MAVPGSTTVSEAAARNLFKLMAVKDEYEVARLYTDGSFQRQLAAEFESFDRLEFHVAPPVFARRDKGEHPRKARYGQWMMKVLAVLARLRWLRGTALDPFGYTAERRIERRLLAQYEADLDRIEAILSPGQLEAVAAFASVPSLIRGFGHVKEANARRAAEERTHLLGRLEGNDTGLLSEAADWHETASQEVWDENNFAPAADVRELERVRACTAPVIKGRTERLPTA